MVSVKVDRLNNIYSKSGQSLSALISSGNININTNKDEVMSEKEKFYHRNKRKQTEMVRAKQSGMSRRQWKSATRLRYGFRVLQ